MKRVLLIGNFLSKYRGTKATSEILSELLKAKNWDVITSSSNPTRVLKPIDMCWTAWRRQNEYDIAHVDVFSGYGFIWAEMVSNLLKLMRKPFILTFRALSILDYVELWSDRIRFLMSKANKVTTPSHVLQLELKRFRQDIQYLPIGLDLIHYPFKLRQEPNPRLCWLRSFGQKTNPIMAPEVISLLRGKFPEIHLTMFGPNLDNRLFCAVQKLIKKKICL